MRPIHVLILIVGACLAPLFLGAESFLEFALPGDLPLGTLLAAVAFMAAAGIPYTYSSPRTWLRRGSGVLLIAATVWLPLGILLSGNAGINFVDDAADSAIFWRFTYGLAGLILVAMLWAAVESITSRRRR